MNTEMIAAAGGIFIIEGIMMFEKASPCTLQELFNELYAIEAFRN